jgi:hypothetical protein
MGATVVNGNTAASGAVSAKGNPMNRNLFFDPIALRANAVPATVES